MCILDCSPSALKLLHNSPEFMPFVIFIAAPGMDQLKQLYAERRATGGSQRNLAVSWCTKLILKLSGFCLFHNSRLTCLVFVFSVTIIVHQITFSVWSSKLNQIQLTSSSHIGITSVFVWGKFDVVVIVTDSKNNLNASILTD